MKSEIETTIQSLGILCRIKLKSTWPVAWTTVCIRVTTHKGLKNNGIQFFGCPYNEGFSYIGAYIGVLSFLENDHGPEA